MVDGQRQAGKRHEGIAGEDDAPGIAREDVHPVAVLEVELLGGVLEAVEERRAGCAQLDFGLVHVLQPGGVNLGDAGAEDDALALADGEAEVARHPEVLGVRHAALHVLGVLDVLVPVGVVHPLDRLGELHVEVGEALV